MKRHISLLIVLIVTLFVVVGVGSAQTTTAVGTVTAWYLNVRTAPFADADRITTVSRGYTAGVIGKNADASWYQIILEGGSGWVSGHYLAVTNAHTVPVTYSGTSSQAVVAGGYVNTGALNIRTVPSPTNNVPITYVLRNTPLTIFARNNDSSWYKVTTSTNIQGWVRGKYVNVTSGDISSLPIVTENIPVPTPTPVYQYAQGYVNTGALNVRTVPSPFNNTPLRYVLRNRTVNIIGRTGDSEWYQVSVEGIVGWMRGKYIAITSGNIANAPVTG